MTWDELFDEAEAHEVSVSAIQAALDERRGA